MPVEVPIVAELEVAEELKPFAFAATTAKVYAVPLVRPVTTHAFPVV
jgi:hypothetical protein